MIQVCKFINMWKKVLLNVFYNVAVIISVMGIYYGITNNQYLYCVIFLATGAFFVYQKIKLLKAVKAEIRNKK
ncbi:DUF6358 family protein [Pedobacter flavus]|uniref:DUF6358 family protein n=1 Tax=Pedobacter flavus TaxID=3113906 RepID=UPI003D66DCF4